jgi:hypothetical protein
LLRVNAHQWPPWHAMSAGCCNIVTWFRKGRSVNLYVAPGHVCRGKRS